MIKKLRIIESDDKITAKTFQELISKLEDRGYSCEHYYDITYPDGNWLYIEKNGDPYEAEFYRYGDGEYELYLHNIHPTRRNESVKRNKLMEKSNFDDTQKAIDYYYPKWYYDDMSVNDIYDALERLGHSQDFIDAVIDGITDRYENEEDRGLGDYDECLDESNVVGMGGGYPNVYLPKGAKEYLKRKGFQEVNTEIGPCFYMQFTGNDYWEIYIDEQYGGIYVVKEGYDLKPTDDIATIDDYDYKDDIDAVINLGNCLANGNDFNSCLDVFFGNNSYTENVNCKKNYFKEDTDLYHDATKAVYDFFSRKCWDTNIPEVANYAEGVIELLELDPEFATGEYTMKDWYKDTQINYPEDIEWLDSTTY